MNETLERIAEEIRVCEKCPLFRGRLRAVPGSGSGRSGIVFIGEGPGAQEDKSGVPFVGAAGKFLDEMLADIGLSRDDVFITNVVKCRPPDNRDPEPDEAQICTDTFLWRQIEILKPKLIVTLGRHAMGRFIQHPPEYIAPRCMDEREKLSSTVKRSIPLEGAGFIPSDKPRTLRRSIGFYGKNSSVAPCLETAGFSEKVRGKKISEVHGMLFKLTSPKTNKTFAILPLYHPAAALYNGRMRAMLKEDFRRILFVMNGKKQDR